MSVSQTHTWNATVPKTQRKSWQHRKERIYSLRGLHRWNHGQRGESHHSETSFSPNCFYLCITAIKQLCGALLLLLIQPFVEPEQDRMGMIYSQIWHRKMLFKIRFSRLCCHRRSWSTCLVMIGFSLTLAQLTWCSCHRFTTKFWFALAIKRIRVCGIHVEL